MFTFVRCPAGDLADAARAAGVEASFGPTGERGWTTVLATQEVVSAAWLEPWPRLAFHYEPAGGDEQISLQTSWRLTLRVPPLEIRIRYPDPLGKNRPLYAGDSVEAVAGRLVDLFGHGSPAEVAAVLRRHHTFPHVERVQEELAAVLLLPPTGERAEREIVLHRGSRHAAASLEDRAFRTCELGEDWTVLVPDDPGTDHARRLALKVASAHRRGTTVRLWRGAGAYGWSIVRHDDTVLWTWSDFWLRVGDPTADAARHCDRARVATKAAVRRIAPQADEAAVQAVLERAGAPRTAMSDFARLVGLPSAAVAALDASAPEYALPRLKRPVPGEKRTGRGVLGRLFS